MHQHFQKKFKELNLSMAEVEAKIECTPNYLSRFINGKQKLPPKWERKIQDFIDGIEKQLKAIPALNPDHNRPWIKIIVDFCKGAGIEPEDLVAWYKSPEIGPLPPKKIPNPPDNWATLGKVEKLKLLKANR